MNVTPIGIRQSHFYSAVLVLAVSIGCGPRPSTTKRADSVRLDNQTGISLTVINTVKSHGANLRRLIGRDEEENSIHAPGVIVDVEAGRVPDVIQRLRNRLGPGYVVFRSDQKFNRGPDEVAVLRANDQFEALRVMGVNGANHDLTSEAILKTIKKWDRAHGLRIVGAGFDWAEAEFRRTPQDMLAFAQEVYKFCPDVVDQGTGTVEALAREMARTNRVYLWWD